MKEFSLGYGVMSQINIQLDMEINFFLNFEGFLKTKEFLRTDKSSLPLWK